jgi:hypothetical protein
VAIFTVDNGTGIDSNGDFFGDGVQFGTLTQFAMTGMTAPPFTSRRSTAARMTMS